MAVSRGDPYHVTEHLSSSGVVAPGGDDDVRIYPGAAKDRRG